MQKYYSLKYQESKMRDFVSKYKNWLDYSDMNCTEHGSRRQYTYNKLHGKDYLDQLTNLKDTTGMHPIGLFQQSADKKDSRIELWVDHDFYRFTDRRFELFVKEFVKDNKKSK